MIRENYIREEVLMIMLINILFAEFKGALNI